MGANQTKQEPKQEPKKETCKPCCACPETREIRDKCIFEKGEAACQKEIEGHKICLKKLGFD